MIPKIIHLIWFGGKPFPDNISKYINTWKEKLPDYEIKYWNEATFDVNAIPFTREAFQMKKWAFISDYVRIFALYNWGGWYFDTDVEILKSFDSLLDYRLVMSTDEGGFIESAIIGSEAGHVFLKEVLDSYKNRPFILANGKVNTVVINTYLQECLQKYGYVKQDKLQYLHEGIVLFTSDYFHVISLETGLKNQSEHTYAIHWHTLLWVSPITKLIKFVRLRLLVPLFGPCFVQKIRKICRRD